ncbi:uncharacterized protein LOC128243974 [Mya arenaria]|uniref:uncharacterized protein LOC128243974 n=1 Tax=Mya arenaria TaxID=6604 RepID=UPI0022E7F114|nr:uncharacterized protein LOC128243974 [Mya arenaria]
MLTKRRVEIALTFLILFVSLSMGFYLISDYYMDDSWAASLGQVCGKTAKDDSLYLNSHLNHLKIVDYSDNIQCTTQLDAGRQHDARYKIEIKRFDLEYTHNCTGDYLEIYNTNLANISSTVPDGRFCGDKGLLPKTSWIASSQYVVFKFRTDYNVGKNGFRILATRTIPAPCPEDYFHCRAENRCIDHRLNCDGTPHCDDEEDETDCSFWEKIIGAVFALGVSGIVGIVFICIVGCTGIGVGICVCTCCRKRCARICCKTRDNKVGHNLNGTETLTIDDERASQTPNSPTQKSIKTLGPTPSCKSESLPMQDLPPTTNSGNGRAGAKQSLGGGMGGENGSRDSPSIPMVD